jgi:nucleoside phosphorylase
MFTQSAQLFLISDLKKLDSARNNWFDDDSVPAMAGRCLLDAIEYIRSVPPFPLQFHELVNAHAIRLICRYLSDKSVARPQVLDRSKVVVLQSFKQLQTARLPGIPHYGDDFWDWAAILEAFEQVRETLPDAISKDDFNFELESFHAVVREKSSSGLTTGASTEWYGPATAAIAYRVIRSQFPKTQAVLGELRKQALELITNNQYRGAKVEPYQALWHYGQVVAEFGAKFAAAQSAAISNLASLDGVEKKSKVYALARVIQGAVKAKDRPTLNKCVAELKKCQDLRRPLGYGVVGDEVKGSLNVMEALWPVLNAKEKGRIGSMVDALLAARVAANKVGIVLAINNENKALRQALAKANATVTRDGETHHARTSNFWAVVQPGKSTVGALEAAGVLIEKYQVRWLIMCGVAGSLGKHVTRDGGVQFVGPDKGSVVVAAASAPYRIRDKVREQVENAKVPFDGSAWMMMPTDPVLFRFAHMAADEMFGETKAFYEGLIVTGTGIKDSRREKAKILKEFPGGLAVEEEGYLIGLLCSRHRVAFLNIRGISDRAGGDKKAQSADPKQEAREQGKAASAAARLTVKVIELLSQCW